MVPRAFLSHSSADKYFVERVADQLGRGQIQIDSRLFEPGVDFRESIRTAVADAGLLVLFASRASLESFWVKYELDAAEVRGKPHLTFLLDRDLSAKDLPTWMRTRLVEHAASPSKASRLIQNRLVELSATEEPALFFGRERDLEEIAGELSGLRS